MWCCKRKTSLDVIEEELDNISKNSEENEDLCIKYGISHLEVREWEMILRENNIFMEEYNMKLKKQRMKDLEEREARQRKAREEEIREKERELQRQRTAMEEQMAERLARQREIEEREQQLHVEQQRLKEIEFELLEKNSILEITLRMNEKEEKFALQLRKQQALELERNEAALIHARQREIEEREKDIARRQQNLDERELQLEEKSTILEIAIRVNEFRLTIVLIVNN